MGAWEAQTDHFVDDFVHENVVHNYDIKTTSHANV